MTSLQIILIILGSLITLFFLVAFLLPSSKKFYRSIEIESPVEQVFKLVSDFNYYKEWSPWSETEPEANTEISGEPGTVGHKWEWKGKKIGEGYLQIKEIDQNTSLKSDLIFQKPREMISEDIWKFEKLGEDRTFVTWGHYSLLGYPVERFVGLRLEKMLAPNFEKGLLNLKALSESRSK
jgi:ribosome-associated toxin RatA of RatAB toxin-antitoxin module